MKLTQRTVAALTLPAGRAEAIHFDDDIAGFGLRLRKGGSRAWVFQYVSGAKQRRMTFGKYPAMDAPKAREQAANLHAQVKLGGDPAGMKADSRARADETFEACMRRYLARRRTEVRPGSYAEIERHLTKNLAALHGLRIDKVDKRTIALELSRITDDSGPVQANRTRSSLSRFLNWCAGEGFVEANHAAFTNKNEERSRNRVLTNDELRTIWNALPAGEYGEIIRLLILTGQRRTEIGSLEWAEVDLGAALVSLPGNRTKNHLPHDVPLSAPALAILGAVHQRSGKDSVFGDAGTGFKGWSKATGALAKAAKLKERWTLHDLRRTMSTWMHDNGVDPHIVEAILNHISGHKAGVAGVYNRAAYAAEKTTALARWAEHIAAVVAERQSNVTPLKRA